jgi:hypothetical protein
VLQRPVETAAQSRHSLQGGIAGVDERPLCGMRWMAPASTGVAMRHTAVVFNRL